MARPAGLRVRGGDQADVDRIITEIEQEWGTPDILVNNAGIQRQGTVHRLRPWWTGPI